MIENKLLDYDEKILTDYIKFLSTEEGTDILPYAYLSAGDAYENLIQNSKDYYLFNDEVSLIKNNYTKLSHYLSDIDNIIEIGPGSNHTVMNKTLPILQYAKKVKTYLPVDISADYLTDACDTIKKYMPKLKVDSIECDIIESPTIKVKNISGNNALVFFGSTLGNFKHNIQQDILTNIYNLLQPEDIFLITLDTMMDIQSLIKAYNNSFLFDILSGSLNYFTKLNNKLEFYKDKFEACCDWNKEQSCIELYFTIKDGFDLLLPSNKVIKILKGQQLRGIRSQKFDLDNAIKLLNKTNFTVIDILDNSNKMKMFVCKRN